MQYQLNISLTDEDYFAFSYFYHTDSPWSKPRLKSSRTSNIILGSIFLIVGFLLFSADSFYYLYLAVFGAFLLFNGLFTKKILAGNIRKNTKNAQEAGTLLYDPLLKLEFYEDKLVEIVPNGRYEDRYVRLKQIFVLPDYVFCFTIKGNAYILPVAQLEAQVDKKEFLDFLASKCQNVTYC